MKLFFACITIFILGYYPLYAQSNADYFPYEKNNYWEYYWVEFGYPDTIVSLSVFDSVDNQGRKIAVFDSYFINPIVPPALLPDSGTYIIDTSLNVFSDHTPTSCNQEYDLIYKLNGNQGDQWVICDLGSGGYHYEIARIKEIYDDVILGVSTKLMWIEYYLAEDSTDTTGLARGGDVLAKGFGLQSRQGEGLPGFILTGAVINGILYGDTTNIIVGIDEEDQFNQPEGFELYQNYPNPFNPITNIRFRTANFGFVSLKVYDVLGNEIRTLVNEEKPAGESQVKFDGRNLASGIYLYQLKTDGKTISKKMILLK